MSYLDEEIAKMLRKERMKEKKMQDELQRKEEEKSIDEEVLLKEMEQGICKVIDKEFVFEEKKILEERVKVYIPNKNLQIHKDFKDVYIAGENEYGVGLNYVLVPDDKEIQPWDVYKENMLKNLQKTKMRLKWLEEGAWLNRELKLHYMEFISMSGLGTMHNHMYMADTCYGRLTANINYDQKEEKYWKAIVKAMMKKIEII